MSDCLKCSMILQGDNTRHVQSTFLLRVFLMVLMISSCLVEEKLECTEEINICPPPIRWKYLSKERRCIAPTSYVCLQNWNQTLVEGCFPDTRIPGRTEGCPYALRCDPKTGFPALAYNDYHYCPAKTQGCPEANHSGYNISQISKYEKCTSTYFRQQQSRETTIRKEKTSMSPSSRINISSLPGAEENGRIEKDCTGQHIVIAILVVLTTATLSTSLALAVKYTRKGIKRRGGENQTTDINYTGSQNTFSETTKLLPETQDIVNEEEQNRSVGISEIFDKADRATAGTVNDALTLVEIDGMKRRDDERHATEYAGTQNEVSETEKLHPETQEMENEEEDKMTDADEINETLARPNKTSNCFTLTELDGEGNQEEQNKTDVLLERMKIDDGMTTFSPKPMIDKDNQVEERTTDIKKEYFQNDTGIASTNDKDNQVEERTTDIKKEYFQNDTGIASTEDAHTLICTQRSPIRLKGNKEEQNTTDVVLETMKIDDDMKTFSRKPMTDKDNQVEERTTDIKKEYFQNDTCIASSQVMQNQDENNMQKRRSQCTVSCMNCTDNVEKRCVICKMDLCPQCAEGHRKCRGIIPYQTARSCRRHKEKSAFKYCMRCAEYLCDSCLATVEKEGSHYGHPLQAFEVRIRDLIYGIVPEYLTDVTSEIELLEINMEMLELKNCRIASSKKITANDQEKEFAKCKGKKKCSNERKNILESDLCNVRYGIDIANFDGFEEILKRNGYL